MVPESVNGSKPQRESANGSSPGQDDEDCGTEFERFERLTRQILSVPKDEVDRKRERAKRKVGS